MIKAMAQAIPATTKLSPKHIYFIYFPLTIRTGLFFIWFMSHTKQKKNNTQMNDWLSSASRLTNKYLCIWHLNFYWRCTLHSPRLHIITLQNSYTFFLLDSICHRFDCCFCLIRKYKRLDISYDSYDNMKSNMVLWLLLYPTFVSLKVRHQSRVGVLYRTINWANLQTAEK